MFKMHRSKIINFKNIIKIQLYEIRLFLQIRGGDLGQGKLDCAVMLHTSLLLYVCHQVIWKYERTVASDADFPILTKVPMNASGIFILFYRSREKWPNANAIHSIRQERLSTSLTNKTERESEINTIADFQQWIHVILLSEY